MELLEEIKSSRRVGYRIVDSDRGDWEDMGIEKALQQASLLVRFKTTLAFVTQSLELESLKKSRILDAGEHNPFAEWLKREHGILVHNTPPRMDFDYAYRNEQNIGKFDFVFAFEILEHLMNPLSFLEFLKSCLTDNGRIFFISRSTFLTRLK
jgi:hypothetical protein